MQKPAPQAVKAGSREWIGLGVIALPSILYSMDLTVLNLAIPHLSADLQPSATQTLWIMDIYGFMVAGCLITMGTLGDRIGRRKLLLIGAACFGVTSLIAAFSPTAELLIVARGLLGISAATLAPSTLSLIRNMFLNDSERTFAIGVWIASFSAGGALGPIIGGLILEHFWWGAVFLINVPVMALLLALGPFLLPESKDPDPGKLDPFSALQSIIAVLAIIYGLKQGATEGLNADSGAAIVIGIAMSALFVHRQLTLEDPLIDVRLFRVPAIGGALAVNVVGIFILFGAFFYVAQYLQLALGMGPLEAGLWLAPSGVIFAAGSLLTPAIARRFRPSRIIACGFAVTALGFVVLTQVVWGSSWPVLAGLVLFSTGFASVATLTTDLVMTAAPPERAGAASAVSETSFEFGGALGMAVLGSIFTLMYRRAMLAAAGDVPPEALAAARETLNGAVETARNLPGPASEALLAAGREAFGHSLAATSAISAVLAVLTAVFAALYLRGPHDRSGLEREAARQPVTASLTDG